MAEKEFDKYIVIKKEELDYILDVNPVLKKTFDATVALIEAMRVGRNKKPRNNYIVCNQDEPYAAAVWKIVLDGEDKKNAPKE